MWQAFSRFVVGEPTRTELPQRVRETIERQQENSEILIGWAQLTLVLLFGVLYAISPKTSPMMGIEPVPVALALYLLFTVGRLVIACKRKITNGVLMASIVMDISLLIFLIWTFHIQYEQPPSFYLKAPTMLYIRNYDRPGFIGGLGTVLGDAGLNIATFHLGRRGTSGEALALVEVDGDIDDDLLAKVRTLPQVVRVNALKF